MAYAFVVFGLLLLIVGGETVLRGGVGLSRLAGLSPLVIGLMVVSSGTSAPEMVVSLQAAARGAPDLVIGNIIGSNIVNVLLILGFGALLRPIPVSPKIVLRDGGALMIASIALFVLTESGTFSRQSGMLLLAAFVLYMIVSFASDWRRPMALERADIDPLTDGGRQPAPAASLLLLIFGLVCLYFGGGFVVDGGLAIARLYHVPQAVVGLTLVTVGSSLPELVTTIVASVRGHTSIAAGNLIGSNVFNIFFVLGITSLVYPFAVPRHLFRVDAAVMVAAALILPPMLASRWRMTRMQGFLFMASYAVYLFFLAWRYGILTVPALGLG